MLTALSGGSYLLMIGALLGLFLTHSVFSPHLMVITAQLAALGLIIWARISFGRRSFHVTAKPTDGGLVKSGPYRFIRHPIYTAVSLFAWAGALAHPTLVAGLLAILVLVASLIRLLAEEHLLVMRYTEYREYAANTKRMLPYVF